MLPGGDNELRCNKINKAQLLRGVRLCLGSAQAMLQIHCALSFSKFTMKPM